MMNRSLRYRHFVSQKLLVEKFFPAFECHLKRGVLECIGQICPIEGAQIYTISIRYRERGIPEVRIKHPSIAPCRGIHMYRSGELCLYHPPSQPWSPEKDLHKTIVPWTAEWLVYYELFLTEGKWLGPEVPHDELP